MIKWLISLVIFSCTQFKIEERPLLYKIQYLWVKNLEKKEIKNLIPSTTEKFNKLVMKFAETNFYKLEVNFDKNNRPMRIWYEPEKEEIKNIHELIPCNWKIEEEIINRVHVIYFKEKGICVEKNISFKFDLKKSSYIIEFKRKN